MAPTSNTTKLRKPSYASLVVLGLLLLASGQMQPAHAQSKNIQDAIHVIVMFCVAGGEKFEVTSVGNDNAGLELKKEGQAGGAGITISKSEATGLVDGIRREMSNISAAQASEARKCMQPYIDRILDVLLGKANTTIHPPPLSLPSKSIWSHNGSKM